jgi:hypothetical protein
MIHNWWTPKGFIFAAAIASLACVAVIVAIGLAYPEPVSSAELGPEWQCSRLAFVWTTCRRTKHAQSASVRLAGEPACRRPRT